MSHTTTVKKFSEYEYQNSCILQQEYLGKIEFEIVDGLIGNTPSEVCESLIIKGLITNPLANFSFETNDSFQSLHSVTINEFRPETNSTYGYIDFRAIKSFRLVRPNNSISRINNSVVIPNIKVDIEKKQINGRNVIKYNDLDLKSPRMGLKQDGDNYFKKLEVFEAPGFEKKCSVVY